MRYVDRCLSQCGGSTNGALLPEVRSLSASAVRIHPVARPVVPCSRKSGRSTFVRSAIGRAPSREQIRYFGPAAAWFCRRFLLASAVRVPRLVHLEKSLSRNGPNAQNRPPQIQTESSITRLNPDRSNQFIIARHAVNVICAIQRNFIRFSAQNKPPCTKSGRFSRKIQGFPRTRTPAGYAERTDGGSIV